MLHFPPNLAPEMPKVQHSTKTVPGTVIPRSNGRFLAQGYRRDPETGKVTRPSLGTFATRDEAKGALKRDDEAKRALTRDYGERPPAVETMTKASTPVAARNDLDPRLDLYLEA